MASSDEPDDQAGAARAGLGSVGLAVVTLVAEGGARRTVTIWRKKWVETGRYFSRLAGAERMVVCLSTKETRHGRSYISSSCN